MESGIAKTCENCHSLNPGWTPAGFNHANFPLTLGHSVPTCADCHTGVITLIFLLIVIRVIKLIIIQPQIQTIHHAGFPTTCNTCHNTNPGGHWLPIIIQFPLTLGHSSPTCKDCHNGNYVSVSPDCYTCHQQDYTATSNPNHAASGFPTTCETCHTLSGWTPASYNHSTFPLTLGHSILHAQIDKGNYTTPSDCYSCHQPNYTATTNPNHVLPDFQQHVLRVIQ